MSGAPHYPYAPFFCEENVWHWARHPDFAGSPRCVVFVSNQRRQCPLWGQRAGGSGPVVWDYHVILAVQAAPGRIDVLDADCWAGPRLTLGRWLAVSFPSEARLPAEFRPRFRVVDADAFLERFASDRRHMRTSEGWSAEPPPWPPIGTGFNLFEFVDMSTEGPGRVATLGELPRTLEDRFTHQNRSSGMP